MERIVKHDLGGIIALGKFVSANVQRYTCQKIDGQFDDKTSVHLDEKIPRNHTLFL